MVFALRAEGYIKYPPHRIMLRGILSVAKVQFHGATIACHICYTTGPTMSESWLLRSYVPLMVHTHRKIVASV